MKAGFTLVEMMLAVLVLALLSCAATLSFSRPAADAGARETQEMVWAFDRFARDAARASGQPVALVFDISEGTIARFEGTNQHDRRALARLPRGYQIDAVRVGRRYFGAQPAKVEISPSGFSRSYAVRLRGPRLDGWLVFAGLGGEMTKVKDDSTVETMLGTDRSLHSDIPTRDDAD